MIIFWTVNFLSTKFLLNLINCLKGIRLSMSEVIDDDGEET